MNTSLKTRTQATPKPTCAPAPHVGLLQRTCACGGAAGVTGECDGCNGNRLSLQRRPVEQQAGPGLSPPIVREALRSPGQPLDTGTRAFMESRFGHDFSRVRVHTDDKAARSAQAVNALAYTVGQDTVFGQGQYAPETSAGRRLLAHELAHTIQQGVDAPVIQGRFEVSSPADASEREADAASEAVMRGLPATITEAGNTLLARAAPGADESTGQTPAAVPSDTGTETDQAPTADTEKAPACPIKTTGTLSEVSWGETSGLYPSDQNKYDPSKWDAAKTCELLKTRGAVHAIGDRGQRVHRASPRASDPVEQKLKVYHLIENFPALDSEISDTEVKWFYLSPYADKPEVHPGTTGTMRVKSYGSFHNVGGGDVKKGDVYIHFYKLKPKEKKPEEKKPEEPKPKSTETTPGTATPDNPGE